jgi:threonine/homoserine/homoserine lactone efflux protein
MGTASSTTPTCLVLPLTRVGFRGGHRVGSIPFCKDCILAPRLRLHCPWAADGPWWPLGLVQPPGGSSLAQASERIISSGRTEPVKSVRHSRVEIVRDDHRHPRATPLDNWMSGSGSPARWFSRSRNRAGATSDGQPATWVNVMKLVLGLLLLLLALKQWRGRPHGDGEPVTPKWMQAIEGFGPWKTLVAGALLAGANPKNALLAIAAAASIASIGLGGGEEAVAYLVFALIGTLGVAAPVVIYFAMGERAGTLLDGLKRWMMHNNVVIMAVLLLVIGANLVGEAISGFSS